ncbi:TRIC cation channel family protein [Nocardioides panacisoli]|uniref:trimeric intracellular cation channel family protein n=1 Tax=Nocardioides panacisoli TaxID=627624 RepID=UPI001C625C4F|nr:TRIC cation channel family protein [Nocardioides panacisoli]QYJ03011.1 TRIC cation channel family protein [Nocardioides panacisoli]
MVLIVLDLAGVAVFAVSGGLLAVRRQLDVVGVLVLAVVTGLGGGVIRDVLIGDVPPPGFADWRYLLTAVTAGVVAFWFHPALERTIRMVNVFDAFGMGLFATAGAIKAVEHGLGPVPAALLGMVTAVGGGMIRDVLADRVPQVLVSNELYAIPALTGAALVVLGLELGLPAVAVAVPAALAVIVWRLLAIWRGWTAPSPRSPR